MSQAIPSHHHPVIALMTDFGQGDGDVGVMKGVIAGIAPDAHIIDITHHVAPQNVASGAWILASAYRYFPKNTVFVCVVDPGVGSARGLARTFHELGTPVNPTSLQRLEVGSTSRRGTGIDAHIVHVDNFGNLITSIPLTIVSDLFTAPQVRVVFPKESLVIEERRRFFADGPNDGQPFIYGDSSGYVGIAIRNGNAAKTLGVGSGATITLEMTGK